MLHQPHTNIGFFSCISPKMWGSGKQHVERRTIKQFAEMDQPGDMQLCLAALISAVNLCCETEQWRQMWPSQSLFFSCLTQGLADAAVHIAKRSHAFKTRPSVDWTIVFGIALFYEMRSLNIKFGLLVHLASLNASINLNITRSPYHDKPGQPKLALNTP